MAIFLDSFPWRTEKEVNIVVTEPEAPITLHRYTVFHVRNSISGFSGSPIALIFELGGSSHKNVAQYSTIYQMA